MRPVTCARTHCFPANGTQKCLSKERTPRCGACLLNHLKRSTALKRACGVHWTKRLYWRPQCCTLCRIALSKLSSMRNCFRRRRWAQKRLPISDGLGSIIMRLVMEGPLWTGGRLFKATGHVPHSHVDSVSCRWCRWSPATLFYLLATLFFGPI